MSTRASQRPRRNYALLLCVDTPNGLAMRAKTTGLLIGNFEKERSARESASSLSSFREYGTPYPFGRQINNLIDTVHFTHSHSSRMLQLADSYIWFMQLCSGSGTSESPRSDLVRFLHDEADITFPDTYKFWPTSDSWYKPPE